MYIEHATLRIFKIVFFGINKTKAIRVMQATKYFIVIVDKCFIDDYLQISILNYISYMRRDIINDHKNAFCAKKEKDIRILDSKLTSS